MYIGPLVQDEGGTADVLVPIQKKTNRKFMSEDRLVRKSLGNMGTRELLKYHHIT